MVVFFSRDDLVKAAFGVTNESFGGRAHAPHMGGAFKENRLFGGQAASQMYAAFKLKYPKENAHTLNYKFVAPGKVDEPIDFHVDRTENVGRILAKQSGKIIGTGHVRTSEKPDLFPSFVCSHLQSIPGPNELTSIEEIVTEMDGQDFIKRLLQQTVFDMRIINFGRKRKIGGKMRMITWLRMHPSLQVHIQPNQGYQAVVMMSDFFIVNVVAMHFRQLGIKMQTVASMHHTVHFHMAEEDVNPYSAYLFEVECEALSHNRAKLQAHLYDERRQCVLTIRQEAFFQTQNSLKAKI